MSLTSDAADPEDVEHCCECEGCASVAFYKWGDARHANHDHAEQLCPKHVREAARERRAEEEWDER